MNPFRTLARAITLAALVCLANGLQRRPGAGTGAGAGNQQA